MANSTGLMIVIETDGTIRTHEYTDCPPLAVVQKAVGGYVRPVPRFTEWKGEPCEAYCDDDGKLKHTPLNIVATELWVAQLGIPISDYLVGPVVILTGSAMWANMSTDDDEDDV